MLNKARLILIDLDAIPEDVHILGVAIIVILKNLGCVLRLIALEVQ